ncbi:MAG: hydroxymethylglutaryl-CoA lyase [Flavobacteriales bacterium]|nr:hydroxymethylglutaryl-CoA lyase [Flavobacteriales bacterium]
MVKIIECPRDAMQGLPDFIPTDTKADYINELLKVGFDTIDFGSFVSPKAIPQLKDTAEVVEKLDLSNTDTKLLSIVGNSRGARQACSFEQISYLGYPHSISPTFLKRNINSDKAGSLQRVEEMLDLCAKAGKELVVYMTMGFGNPYGDPWNVDIVEQATDDLYNLGVRIIPLSDTTGVSTLDGIEGCFSRVIPKYPDVEFGFHLHTTYLDWYGQISAAYMNGCRRFDTVMLGLGGCPMADDDDLTGNMKTVNLKEYCEEKNIDTGLNKDAFEKAYIKSLQIFHKYLA